MWRWDQTEPYGDSAPNEDPDGDSVSFSFPIRFPGQYADAETGQNYNYQRDCYDPGSGRYCQSDPIGLTGGSLTPYAYVYSSPLLISDPTGEFGVPGLVVGAIIGGGAYAVGQVLSGQPITTSGLLLNTVAGGISGASGAYIYAGVARLGVSAVSRLALNAAANAAVNVALSVPIQVARNAQQHQCLSRNLGVTILRSGFFGAAGGYLGARIAGVAPTAGTVAQQYLNRIANTMLPKGPVFTGNVGPISSTVAGAVNSASFVVSNVVQSASTLFPGGRP